MLLFRRLLAGFGLFFLVSSLAIAQSDASAAGGQQSVPVFRSTTTLVYLDITVVDKKGNPVVTGLTRDDFTITEDDQPQRIFSFEAPDAHGGDVSAEGQATGSPDAAQAKAEPAAAQSKAAPTILVLDLLNTQFADFAFVRDQTRAFLMAQPEEMSSPVEMLVLGNTDLKVLVPATRNRQELVTALDHLPKVNSYKAAYAINFMFELFRQSYDALQQIAIENRGTLGRKSVIWIGMGPPAIDGSRLADPQVPVVKRYLRHTVNLMVESRVTLFEINPGLQMPAGPTETKAQELSVGTSNQSIASDNDHTLAFTPFARSGDKFSDFVDETGGKVFNQNDVNAAL